MWGKDPTILERTPQQPDSFAKNKHLARVGKKNPFLTGKNLQQDQAQVGDVISCEWTGCGREPAINNK